MDRIGAQELADEVRVPSVTGSVEGRPFVVAWGVEVDGRIPEQQSNDVQLSETAGNKKRSLPVVVGSIDRETGVRKELLDDLIVAVGASRVEGILCCVRRSCRKKGCKKKRRRTS